MISYTGWGAPAKIETKMTTWARRPPFAQSGQLAVPRVKVPNSGRQACRRTPAISCSVRLQPGSGTCYQVSGYLSAELQMPCFHQICTVEHVLIINMVTIQLLGQVQLTGILLPSIRQKASLELNSKGQRIGRKREFPTRFLSLQEQALWKFKRLFSL